jgi:hypothetical protein
VAFTLNAFRNVFVVSLIRVHLGVRRLILHILLNHIAALPLKQLFLGVLTVVVNLYIQIHGINNVETRQAM